MQQTTLDKAEKLFENNKVNFDLAGFVTYYKRNYDRPRPLPQQPESWPQISAQEKTLIRGLINKLASAELAEGLMGQKLARLSKPKDPVDGESWELFAREETRHGEEILGMAEPLGIDLAEDRSAAFKKKLMGQIIGLFNLGRAVDTSNLIVVGEIIALTLYKELVQRYDHPLIKAVFTNIIRDEAAHLRYHGARVRSVYYGPRTSDFGRGVLKFTHQFGLLVSLVTTAFVTRPSLCKLAKMNWRETVDAMELDYNKFVKKELPFLYSPWAFKVVRWLPLS